MTQQRVLLIEELRPAATSGELQAWSEEDGLRELSARGGQIDLVVLHVPAAARAALLASVRALAPDAEVALAVPAGERRAALDLLDRGASALIEAPPEPREVAALAAQADGRRQARRAAADQSALARALASQTPEEALPALLDAWAGALAPDCALIFGADAGGEAGRLGLIASRELGAPAPTMPWIEDLVSRRPAPALYAEPAGELPPPPAEPGALLVVPLLFQHKLVGALVALRHDPFTAADLERIAPLAGCGRLLLGVPHLQRTLARSDRLASLGQLTASVGHELRSPLAYVVDNALFLSDEMQKLVHRAEAQPGGSDGAGSQLREMVRCAEETLDGARRMKELLRDVAAFASADEATLVPVDLNEPIRAAVRLTRPEVKLRAQVICRLDDDLKVIGNVPRLTQVFVNLLVNAAQALANRASQDGRVVVLSRREGNRVLVEVSDNGPGIPAAVLPRIFDAFFTTKAPGEGTGLGLFLCRDITRAHRGSIHVRSSATRGTTFTVELPHADAKAEPAPLRLASSS